MACSHSGDTTGSVRGSACTPAASDTADDDVALHRAATPNAPAASGGAPHPYPPAPCAARAAHPTRLCTHGNKGPRQIGEDRDGGREAGFTTAGSVAVLRSRSSSGGRRVSLGKEDRRRRWWGRAAPRSAAAAAAAAARERRGMARVWPGARQCWL